MPLQADLLDRSEPSAPRAPMMRRVVGAVLASALFALSTAQSARADIYTWTDANGSVNVSNIAPPEGVHVTKVVHDSPPRPQAAIDAAEAAHQAEVRTLNDRVTQLERDADMAARTASRPAPAYPAYYAAPAPTYTSAPQVPAIQYSVYPPESTAQTCDWSWNDCGSNWWTPPIYTTPFFFIPTTGFHHQRPFPGGHFPTPRGPHGPGNRPMAMAGVVAPPLGSMGVVLPPSGVVIPNTGPVVPRIVAPAGMRRN